MKLFYKFIVAFCQVLFASACGVAAPLFLAPDGATGNPNDGLGMPLKEAREQLDKYWSVDDAHQFYTGGEMLISWLRGRIKNEEAAQNYIETCVHILSHGKTTSKDPYGLSFLVKDKGEIGVLLLAGDYLHFIPDGKYQKARMDVIGAGMKLLNDLRSELKADVLILPELPKYPEGKLEGEELAKFIGEAREKARIRLEASSAVIRRKQIPELLAKMESKFVLFVEQEYRRIPPEKGEMENIIAHAGLPKDGAERLKLLIPR